jgi:hypothetical protein
MPLAAPGQPAEDVAPADDQADLGADVARFLDVGRNALDGADVDAEVLGAHQRLAGHLQQDPAEFRRCAHFRPPRVQ